MFRRRESGLPKDVSFPHSLADLGYFVNDDDEIRSLENPYYYFKYHLDRNDRINQRQAFAFNIALSDIIQERLQNEGLQKIPLPLDTDPADKHVPIFMEEGLEKKSRIVVIFGEYDKPVGLLAGRVANGKGGINKGSMVSVVRELRKQRSTENDASPPGIVIANPGQLFWWPEGKRALTAKASSGIPLPSLVHAGRRFVADLNEIKGHETVESHIDNIFEHVVAPKMVEKAVIDIVAIGDTCEKVEKYLDQSWDRWGSRLSSLLLLDTICEVDSLKSESFKDFLAKRARCYLLSALPVDVPLAPPTGNPSLCIQPLGVPCYSSSEPDYTECILITALRPTLSYLERNALMPTTENEPVSISAIGPPEEAENEVENEEPGDTHTEDQAWAEVEEADKPAVHVVNPMILDKEREQIRMWKQFEATGEAPASKLN